MNMRKLLMQRHQLLIAVFASALCAFYGCSDELFTSSSNQQLPLNLSGLIKQENVTRANEQGFVNGDRMGIYVVDRINGVAGTLGASDNRANNVLFTYDGESYRWTSPTTIYWRDQQTPVDIYGYYPGVNYIENPTAYQFSVQTDQSTEAGNGELSGYEQSDLLWGKAANVSYTQEQIVVKYHHILAGVRVQLQKGTGVSDAEWQKLEKNVLLANTTPQATVDLSKGTVSSLNSTALIRMAPQSNDAYRAVVIPQQVAANKPLVSITLDGQTYSHSLTSVMNYEAGKLHNFTLTVNKREASGDYQIALAYDGITPWVNDENSHSFTAMAYVTVHCDRITKLRECITAAGYDYQTIQNLKVTGELSNVDFDLLREGMPELKHLNLKDAKLRHVAFAYWDDNEGRDIEYYRDDALPGGSFYGNKTIRSILLPTSLKRISSNAFREMRLMYSTLEVPEGVTCIEGAAFAYNEYNGVELKLPYSLDSIYGEAFISCDYGCELKLTDNIRYIGHAAFSHCPNFYGVFHVPSKLQKFEDGMFAGLGSNGSFIGEIEIPQGITEIPNGYWGGVFGVSLKNRVSVVLPAGLKRLMSGFGNLKSIRFNDDLEVIGGGAFYNGNLHLSIVLPPNLREIGYRAFCECALEGEVVVPEKCLSIGGDAFCGNEITKVTLPSRLENISGGMFRQCGMLREVNIPKYVDYIGDDAFLDCYALQTIICLNPEPPQLGNNVFGGVAFEKCVLQVPEQSVEAYRHADGWKDFKSITPYHELAFNIPEISCLNKGCTQEGTIRAEGAWEVVECPDWVTVSPMSGTKLERKAELTITVKPLGSLTENREGRIVFRLKDKNYTTYTTVRQQYSAEWGENQQVVLQRAKAGAAREIPIVIIGEGYDADDIMSGQYIEDMREQMEYLFSCEPYKTYRDYFTVSTAIAVSPEHGVNGRTRFNAGYYSYWNIFNTDPGTLQEIVKDYVQQYAMATNDNWENATIILLLNTQQTGHNGTYFDWQDNRTITLLGKSTDTYPFDQRGFVLHEVGGIAFGKLAKEAVNHFTFIKACTCPGCNGLSQYQDNKRRGWYENVTLSSKMNEAPWAHLIFDERFAQNVDMYEGGFNHARGVYRSENMSVMGNSYIPYYNMISRQAIVKRILEYSGEGYNFDKFLNRDKREYPE